MSRITPAARRALVDERKQQILQAAAKIFAAKGFDRATIADIARQAGVAEGSIYNYFKNKGDLLVSIPRHLLEPVIEAVSAQMPALLAATSDSPDAMLTLVARNVTTVVRQNAFIFRILLSALPTMNAATRQKYLNQVVEYAIGALENHLRAQIKSGALRRDLNPAIAARAFIGMFFPFILIREVLQVESAEFDYDQVIATLVPLFLRGAATPSGADGASARKRNAR
ncbi:MAG: TetR/AcrR family transcriptional regulator [Chloroflexi bacterium]|nr:TetR/AcrR family transcriptional regulator [Chloroflexota bacterium]